MQTLKANLTDLDPLRNQIEAYQTSNKERDAEQYAVIKALVERVDKMSKLVSIGVGVWLAIQVIFMPIAIAITLHFSK